MLFIQCILAMIVIVFVIIIWFANWSNNCSCYTIWLTKLFFLKYKQFHDIVYRSNEPHTHIRPFTRIHICILAALSRVTSRLSTFCRLHYTGKTGIYHTEKVGLHHTRKTWKKLMLMSQKSGLAASSQPSLSSLPAALLVPFFCKAWRFSSSSTTTRSEKALICK